MTSARKNFIAKLHSRDVWLAASLLAVMLVLTWALLAAILRPTWAQNVIPLTPSNSSSDGTSYQSWTHGAGIQTADEETTWSSETQIDLFQSSYRNAFGRVTAESADGGKILAPGTSHVYRFTVTNEDAVTLRYALRLEGEAVSGDIPELQFRLHSGESWLVGSEDSWGTLDEINALDRETVLNPTEQDEYQLEWQWPYESTDQADTELGITAAEQENSFRLTITTLSEEATPLPDPVPVVPDQPDNPDNPDNPDQPDNPDNPNPDQPTNPDTPDQPTKPDDGNHGGNTNPGNGGNNGGTNNGTNPGGSTEPGGNSSTSQPGDNGNHNNSNNNNNSSSSNGSGSSSEPAAPEENSRSWLWALLLGLAALAGLLLLALRRPVYVTGFVSAVPGADVNCGRKQDTLRPDGRFCFEKVYSGRRDFTIGDSSLAWRLRRKSGVDGLRLEEDENGPILTVGRDIRAVEVHLDLGSGGLRLNRGGWAAIDRHRNVFTPNGKFPPRDDGGNETPYGLRVDARGSYSFDGGSANQHEKV